MSKFITLQTAAGETVAVRLDAVVSLRLDGGHRFTVANGGSMELTPSSAQRLAQALGIEPQAGPA